ncbi:MAG: hypothetical protein R2941_15100 [Desulfobacterales bacterium]
MHDMAARPERVFVRTRDMHDPSTCDNLYRPYRFAFIEKKLAGFEKNHRQSCLHESRFRICPEMPIHESFR